MKKINIRSPYYLQVNSELPVVYYYALQKCDDSSSGYITGQNTDEISLSQGDRVLGEDNTVYIVINEVEDIESFQSVGNVVTTGEVGCPVPPTPLYWSLTRCNDDTTGYISEQEAVDGFFEIGSRVESNGLFYVVTGTSETGNSVGIITDTGEVGCPATIIPPQTINVNCGDTYNVATDVGINTYKFNTPEIGNINIDITGNDVPVKFTINWNGNSQTTNYIGSDFYNEDLEDLGVPLSEINTANPSNKNTTLSINKTSEEPQLVEVVAQAPLVNDAYSLTFNCPEPPVVINETTQINIWFDDSGSMNTTKAQLESMTQGNLKNCLIGFYNNNESEYNRLVKVRNFSSVSGGYERCFRLASLPPDVSDATNVIHLIFQDEAYPPPNTSYHNSLDDFDLNEPLREDAKQDLENLRYTFDNTEDGKITPVIFQVIFQNPSRNGFKEFLEAVQNNQGFFTDEDYGLKNYQDRMKIYYDVEDGVPYSSNPEYYRNFIVQAINDLGFNLTCP